MAKLKMRRLAYLLAACLLLLAALAGCSNSKTGSTGMGSGSGTTGTPTSYNGGNGTTYTGVGYGVGYGLDNFGGAGYNGATNSSYRSNGGTRTTPNTGYLNGADMATGGTGDVSADM